VTRAPIPALAQGERILIGPVAHYLARVLRLRAGSEFIAFDPAEGTEADAVVLHTEGDAVAVRFGATHPGRAAPALALTWVQGFAKGDKCDAIVRDATELGATRIVMAVTRRSIVKLDDARTSARVARWARIAEEAARQCGRSEVPRVDRPMPWTDALASAAADSRFCLWERACEPLAPGLFDALARGTSLAFACGPEGGIDDDEAAAAGAQGWRTTSLGPLHLRTETVAAAVLGAVRVWSGLGR
jgi:16S rRNA (uracil1498-N3)-methyltransferase